MKRPALEMVKEADRFDSSSAVVTGGPSSAAASQNLSSSEFRSPVKMRSQRRKLSRESAESEPQSDETNRPSAKTTEPQDNDDATSSPSTVVSVDSGTSGGRSTTSSSSCMPDGLKRRCPSCCREVSKATYQSHVISCLRKFSRDATAVTTVELDGSDRQNVCAVCGKSIGHMNERRREQHVNRCLDKAAHVTKTTAAATSNSAESSSQVALLPCPFCHSLPKTQMTRMSHIKKCAAKAGVAPNKLLDVLHLLERQAKEREEAGLSLVMPPPLRHREHHHKRPRRGNAIAEDNNSEDMKVAMALSLSEAEQSSDTVSIVRDAAPREKKRRGKTAGLATPLLLLRTAEDRAAIVAERVFHIVTEQIPEREPSPSKVDWSLAPPHISRFKQNSGKSLWNLASLSPLLTSDPAVFYVESLRPFITPCKVKPGDKMKRLSQVPGYLTQRRTSAVSPSSLGPSTQEIGLIIDAAEYSQADGQAGYLTLAQEDEDDDESDNVVVSGSDTATLISDKDDVDASPKRKLTASSETADHFDGRLAETRQAFWTSSHSPSSKPCKRSLPFLTQPSNEGFGSSGQEGEKEEKGDAKCTEGSENHQSQKPDEDHSRPSLPGSPNLFSDSEDEIFDEIDLDAITNALVKETADKSTDDVFDNTNVSAVGISTSTPKEFGKSTDLGRRKRCISVSPVIEKGSGDVGGTDKLSAVAKKRKSVSFCERTETICLDSSEDLESWGHAKRKQNKSGHSKSSPRADESLPNVQSNEGPVASDVPKFDIWEDFPDNADFYELPTTPCRSSKQVSQADPCEAVDPIGSYFAPPSSSSSEHSQEYLPEVNTPFKKDSSIIVEDRVERKDAKKKTSKRLSKKKSVTPLPHYSVMPTPEIRKELAKIGVKALPKKKATKLLKFVYEETHPSVAPSDHNEDKEDETSKSPVQRKHKKSDKELGNDINDFIKSHLHWHNEILQYKVIDVNALREDLKSYGFKISLHSLKRHLDEQCVTYSDPQSK